MFTVWEVPERRTTLDIDFAAQYNNQIAAIEEVIRDVCKVPVTPDGLIFDSAKVKAKRIKENNKVLPGVAFAVGIYAT